MSEEATKLDEKVLDQSTVEGVKVDQVSELNTQAAKTRPPEQAMSNPLAFLILFSLPFGYLVSSLSGQYATHATFAMVALFSICSLMDQDKNSRYTGFLFAALWSCAGVLFYNMRGI